MKIHYAFFTSSYSNTYPFDLCESIEKLGNEVSYGLDEFWDPTKKYDIIHIHWPESLFKWTYPNSEDIDKLRSVFLKHRENGSIIVTTRHNYTRHVFSKNINEGSGYNDIYNIAYQFSDGLIHLGEFSRTEFLNRYKEFANLQHTTIPHGIYEKYPNDVSKLKARKALKIPQGYTVVLVFGKIRNKKEVDFIEDTFDKINLQNKILLAPRYYWGEKWIPKTINRLSKYIKNSYRLSDFLVPNDQIQYYFNASDIVFIPRVENLNSGVLILGFSFGKVVVGPNAGVIGEILKETQNPVFDVEKELSIHSAIQEGVKLSERGFGEGNLVFAKKNWNWDIIGSKHLKFYNEMLMKKTLR